MDTLATVVATQSDTLTMVRAVDTLLQGWGLPAQVVPWLANLLLGLPTIAVVMLTRTPILQWIAPAAHTVLEPIWERNKTWALPLIVVFVGWVLSGNPMVGAAAIALHQIGSGVVRAAKGTKASVTAGTAGALLLAVGLIASSAGSARAASSPETLPWISMHRAVGTLALGDRWQDAKLQGAPKPYVRWNVGYQVFPFLQVTAGQRRDASAKAEWLPEAECRIILRR